MAKLSDKNKKILLLELNRLIDQHSEEVVGQIMKGEHDSLISYPPNGGFLPEEIKGIGEIKNIPNIDQILRRITAESSARVVFEFLNWIDGTGDPESTDWTGVTLVDSAYLDEEDESMLHDEFFEKYWEWIKIRKMKSERLDNNSN